jgi:ankyrin repeat protein
VFFIPFESSYDSDAEAQMRTVLVLLILSRTLSAQAIPDVRPAIERALPMLQRSASEFVSKRACMSCHHNVLPILSLHQAEERGFAVDSAVIRAVEEKTFRELRTPNVFDEAVQAATLNDPTPNDSSLLMAAHAAGLQPDLITAMYARRIAAWQQQDGHWITSDFRPPHSSSVFTATATAIRAIRQYMPGELAAERDRSILRARQWLFKARPSSTEDAAFRLMGLVWADASREEMTAAQRDLLALQHPSGGWPQIPNYPRDAYSTGEALVALHEGGMPATDAAFVRGLKFLISTQAKDGTWRVATRMLSPAPVSPKYFTTGFPYGKDEFISYAGSSWAVMALLSVVPKTTTDSKPTKITNAEEAPSWSRTALFGSARELAALLDGGLDPNFKTKNGTTLLMMTATDAEKVRLLIERRADAKLRATSGCNALTIAAAHRGTSASLQLLLDAGAETRAPEGIRQRHTPLAFASMNGDLDNVNLLLRRGAEPSAEALSEAVTFNHPDVVQALITRGADVGITESSGINLLHWATITNRPAVIPILVKAGVPLNDLDDFGYTPLMYAATIDFGDTAVLKELLKAGADRNIRNESRRTALEQARFYKHDGIAAEINSQSVSARSR